LRADVADLRAHWRRRVPPVASLWPLALALVVLASAVLVDFSLVIDSPEARAARFYPRGLVDFFRVVTRGGESGWLFALSLLTLAGAFFARALAASRRERAAYGLLASRALYLFAVQLDSGMVSQGLKHFFGRARPPLLETLGPHHFAFFSWPAIMASFPSGHTITAFATAASLGFFLPRRFWPLLYLPALAIAASRLIIGAHYPSDVLAGALIGLACAHLTALVFGRRGIAFDISPSSFRPRPRGGSALAAQPFKALFEVFLQVVDVLKAHRKAQRWAFRLPFGRGAVAGAVEGDDKAFKAAPAVAKAEQFEAVEHRGDGTV
jgi:membrane-associated phospholipid phosphatase